MGITILVDVLSSKFFLILAPEFLGVLSSFFVFQSLSEQGEKDQGTDAFCASGSDNNNSHQKLTAPTVGRATSQRKVAAQQTMTRDVSERQIAVTPSSSEGTMTITGHIYEIEVLSDIFQLSLAR